MLPCLFLFLLCIWFYCRWYQTFSINIFGHLWRHTYSYFRFSSHFIVDVVLFSDNLLWKYSWLRLWMKQIVLCLVEECVGISVVWCSYVGYLVCMYRWMQYKAKVKVQPTLLRCIRWAIAVALVYDGVACVYYAFAEPPITTVAHGCAVLMGVLVAYLQQWLIQGSYINQKD